MPYSLSNIGCRPKTGAPSYKGRAGDPVEPYQVPDGLTVIAIDTFSNDAIRNAASPGTFFTEIVSGQMQSGGGRGCKGRDENGDVFTDARCGYLRRFASSATNQLNGYRWAPLIGGEGKYKCGFWIRPNRHTGMAAALRILTFNNSDPTNSAGHLASLKAQVMADNTVDLYFGDPTTPAHSVTDLPTQAGMYWEMRAEKVSGDIVIKAAYKVGSGALTTFGAETITATWGNDSDGFDCANFLVEQLAGASSAAGISGPFAMLHLTTFTDDIDTDGADYPTNIGVWADSRKLYTIDPATGSDTKVAGPGKTTTWIYNQFIRNSGGIGVDNPWTDVNGTPVELPDSPETALTFAEGIKAGTIIPAGDYIEFSDTTVPYIFSTPLDLVRIEGFHFKGVGSANASLDLLWATTQWVSTPWTQPDSGTYPHVWKVGFATASRGMPRQDSDGKTLIPITRDGSDTPTTMVMLEAHAGTAWFNPNDNRLYVHAIGGIDPNTVPWYLNSTYPASTAAAALNAANGLYESLPIRGGITYNTSGVSVGDVKPLRHDWGFAESVFAIKDSPISDYGKRAIQSLGSATIATTVIIDSPWTRGPIGAVIDGGEAIASTGFNGGDWQGLNGYSDDKGSNGKLNIVILDTSVTDARAVVGKGVNDADGKRITAVDPSVFIHGEGTDNITVQLVNSYMVGPVTGDGSVATITYDPDVIDRRDEFGTWTLFYDPLRWSRAWQDDLLSPPDASFPKTVVNCYGDDTVFCADANVAQDRFLYATDQKPTLHDDGLEVGADESLDVYTTSVPDPKNLTATCTLVFSGKWTSGAALYLAKDSAGATEVFITSTGEISFANTDNGPEVTTGKLSTGAFDLMITQTSGGAVMVYSTAAPAGEELTGMNGTTGAVTIDKIGHADCGVNNRIQCVALLASTALDATDYAAWEDAMAEEWFRQ